MATTTPSEGLQKALYSEICDDLQMYRVTHNASEQVNVHLSFSCITFHIQYTCEVNICKLEGHIDMGFH